MGLLLLYELSGRAVTSFDGVVDGDAGVRPALIASSSRRRVFVLEPRDPPRSPTWVAVLGITWIEAAVFDKTGAAQEAVAKPSTGAPAITAAGCFIMIFIIMPSTFARSPRDLSAYWR